MEQLNQLKNLVMQNLQKNGYLSNIRAQIRASVFKTIDSQQTSNKKASPFYSQNAKVQKLSESKQGQQALQLIQQTISFYKMDNSMNIFNSESNSKSQAKHEQLARKHNVQAKKDEPVLYTIFAKFMQKNKQSVQKQQKKVEKVPQKTEKSAQMPMQMKQDESEGQVQQQIVRNESRKFGQSQEFGQSQGYDITVDSLKLEQYDYYEQIEQ